MKAILPPSRAAAEAGSAAQAARIAMAVATSAQKNCALVTMAKLLNERQEEILRANHHDMVCALESGASEVITKRLVLTAQSLAARISALHQLSALPDPVGEIFHSQEPEPRLMVQKIRVPIGVILLVFESRPHVSVNGPAVCFKSGNCIILRGGNEAEKTNRCLVSLWHQALECADLPQDAVQLLQAGHQSVEEALHLAESIQLVIPRGGRALMDTVAMHARMPVLHHYAGLCHQYVDASANLQKALNIIIDSKLSMPAVCNSMETLLVHRDLLPWCSELVNALTSHGVEVRGCTALQRVVSGISPATEDDWSTEYLSEIVSIKVVGTLHEAIMHINTYGSHHTDGIITENLSSQQTFNNLVDSAVVLCNTSTMYCDGSLLGFGPEIGISTSILHARGPVGASDLTTYKVVVSGNGHTLKPEAL